MSLFFSALYRIRNYIILKNDSFSIRKWQFLPINWQAGTVFQSRLYCHGTPNLSVLAFTAANFIELLYKTLYLGSEQSLIDLCSIFQLLKQGTDNKVQVYKLKKRHQWMHPKRVDEFALPLRWWEFSFTLLKITKLNY